jgi:hypothetical protein
VFSKFSRCLPFSKWLPKHGMENFQNDCFLENNIDSFDTIYYDFICLLIYNEKYRSIQF